MPNEVPSDIRQAAVLLLAADEVLRYGQTMDGALERANRIAFAVRVNPQHEFKLLLDDYIELATRRSRSVLVG